MCIKPVSPFAHPSNPGDLLAALPDMAVWINPRSDAQDLHIEAFITKIKKHEAGLKKKKIMDELSQMEIAKSYSKIKPKIDMKEEDKEKDIFEEF